MISHEQIDEALLRSLPPAQRCLTEDALSDVGAYAKTHGLSWDDIYTMADEALIPRSERVSDAANDEPPLRYALLKPVFGNDKNLVDAVYWLYTHHISARAIFTAITLDSVSDIGGGLNLPIQQTALKSEFVLQKMMAYHAELLEKFGLSPQLAKQSARCLRDELITLATEKTASPSTPSR